MGQDTKPRRRTGRPYRPPTDLTRPTADVPEQRPRLAWLLGTNRMMRLEGEYAHRRDFQLALADHGVACDESKLSRWESGASSVPGEAVRAYEEILGLPPQSLRSAVGLEIDPEPLREAGRLTPREVDALITRTLAGNATGQDWLELTDELLRERHVYLRGKDWTALCTQLLSEQARATSSAYVSRTVAASRLAMHASAQPHLVRAVGALVLDDRVRRRFGAVRLLSAVRGDRTWKLMLRLCAAGERSIRLGAIEVALRHVDDQPRSAEEIAVLEQALAALLEESPKDRTLLAMAAQLPAVTPQFRALVQSLVSAEPAVISRSERTIGVTVAEAAQTRLSWDGEPDPMLASLTCDALFHPSSRRLRAAFAVLDASPYRLPLADAALDLALTNLRTPDPASRAAAEVAHFLQAEDGEKILTVAERAADPRRRVTIVTALAGQPDPLDAEQLDRLNALQVSTDLVDAVVHSLGMLGQLRDLRPSGNAALDERAATMASWWLANGSRVDA